jgi:hypothetical protein
MSAHGAMGQGCARLISTFSIVKFMSAGAQKTISIATRSRENGFFILHQHINFQEQQKLPT